MPPLAAETTKTATEAELAVAVQSPSSIALEDSAWTRGAGGAGTVSTSGSTGFAFEHHNRVLRRNAPSAFHHHRHLLPNSGQPGNTSHPSCWFLSARRMPPTVCTTGHRVTTEDRAQNEHRSLCFRKGSGSGDSLYVASPAHYTASLCAPDIEFEATLASKTVGTGTLRGHPGLVRVFLVSQPAVRWSRYECPRHTHPTSIATSYGMSEMRRTTPSTVRSPCFSRTVRMERLPATST